MKVFLLFGLCLSLAVAAPTDQERLEDCDLTDIEGIEKCIGIEPDENGMYTIGDAQFTAEELLFLYGTGDDIERNGHPSSMARWPASGGTKGVMPYVFASHVSSSLRNKIQTQINRFNQEMAGCLKIAPRSGQSSYVYIQSSDSGCYSSRIGRGGGFQKINIQNPGCTSSGTIVHEFIHALGFWHEQARKDRDNYVRILWNNIKPGASYRAQFLKQSSGLLFGSYDGKSVMHYPRWAFTKNGKNTIEAKSGVGFSTFDIGQRVWMTEKDKQKLRQMYGCGTTTAPVCKFPHWKKDGYCDHDNNVAACGYDGGDCCGSNVNYTYCNPAANNGNGCKCLG